MVLQDEILINKFGQGLASYEVLLNKFQLFELVDRNKFLNDLLFLVLQSKPTDEDVGDAIRESGLKPKFTPCVLLRKGVAYHNLKKIAELPVGEQEKVLKLFLSLFRVSYQRRFKLERNDPNKWWYWDLSKDENIKKVLDQLP
ncbi:DUF5958 family protein [Sphingobacterium sp.]|uniref:DUF5958 family protein n=1 Tax=Sphingobacterium sp. TaxID=341027 RepID=UPI00258B88D2|nr:DUF5958 family protein [Sphingobacterium sp.]WET69680.1 MAG: DUF5958 family protein [Sphingobacterium sp.]